MIEITFCNNIIETSIPIIKLTKSKNGKTGTATFIFLKPKVFEELPETLFTISEMSLLWNNQKITTKDISIIFKFGKPFILKTILIFKNSSEWFQFLNFMNSFSKEKGLFLKIN